jgi:hypothetical protein
LKGIRAFNFTPEICFTIDNQGVGEGCRVDIEYSHKFIEPFKDGEGAFLSNALRFTKESFFSVSS